MPTIYTDGSYITAKGNALIAKLLASQGQLTFTKATVGDGQVPDGRTPESMTALGNYVMDGMIASISNPGSGEASVVVQVSSIGVEAGFNVTELGLYANDPDDGEILYCYLSLQEHPEWIRPEGDPVSKLATFTLVVVVSAVAIVSAVINPDAFAKAADLAHYALIGHAHQIGDIVGLEDILNEHTADISLLNDLVSGDMPGGITFAANFASLGNVEILDGVWDKNAKRLEAGADA